MPDWGYEYGPFVTEREWRQQERSWPTKTYCNPQGGQLSPDKQDRIRTRCRLKCVRAVFV